MSGDNEARPKSSRKPKNVVWLESLYLEIPCNVIELKPGKSILTGPHQVSLLPDKFYLQILKVNKFDVIVSFLRIHTEEKCRDPGCIIAFYFTAVYINEPPRCAIMSHDSDGVSVHYRTESFLTTVRVLGDPNKKFFLKVVVKMLELDNVDNEIREEYEELLDDKRREYMNSAIVKDMAYLLKRPGVINIFTGREDDLNAAAKLSCISRTARFSRELAEYFRAKENKSTHVPDVDFRVVLNHILKGKLEPISKTDLFVLYWRSFRLGLVYLQVITSACICEAMTQVDFLVEAIRAASFVGDDLMFGIAADFFYMHLDQIMNSPRWEWTRKTLPFAAETIIHEVMFHRFSKKKK